MALFAAARGAQVHLMGRSERSLAFARSLAGSGPASSPHGRAFAGVWTGDELPDLPFDAVVDASNAPSLPARALELVEPAGRVVYVGLAGSPSTVDTRTLALKDVTAVGILSGSPGLTGAVEQYASGAVDPRPLVAATVGLDGVADILRGQRPDGAGLGPKMHIDPRL